MRTLAAIAVALLVASCGGSAAQTPTPSSSPVAKLANTVPPGHQAITVAGTLRTYILFRPPGLDTSKPVPLVIVMHGWTQDAAGVVSMTSYEDLASKNGFVAVFPEGDGRSWNAGFCCGHNTDDDVGFISALIDHLVPDQNIDRTRILATGMSNGAMMSQRLGCELAGKITAVVSVSGSLGLDSCSPSRPISILEMHGVQDDTIPYNGGRYPGVAGTFLPSMTVMQKWAAVDGCAGTPPAVDQGTFTSYTWTSCQAGSKVVLDAVKTGSHEWFLDPNATTTGWDFFLHAPPLS